MKISLYNIPTLIHTQTCGLVHRTLCGSERRLGNICVLFAFLIFQPVLGVGVVQAIKLNREVGKDQLCMIKGHVDF